MRSVLVLLAVLSLVGSSALCYIMFEGANSPVDLEQEAKNQLLGLTDIHSRQLAERLGRTESVVRALASFARILRQDPVFLFSIDIDCRKSLNSGRTGEKLQNAFAANAISLTQNATIQILKINGMWLITDQKKLYSIVKASDRLDVYRNTIALENSFYHDKDAESEKSPPGLYFDPRYGCLISTEFSCYKIAPKAFYPDYRNEYLKGGKEANPLEKTDQGVWETVLKSSAMDIVWRSLYSSYPEHVWLYMGFEQGFHRCFPWHYYPDNRYDPRKRGWYTSAKKGKVTWSYPYVDAGGLGMIITASEKVCVGGKSIGVVATDLALSDLIDCLDKFKQSAHSYNFIFDGKGIAVIHPSFATKKPGKWQKDAVRVPIEKLETKNEEFVALKNRALQQGSASAVVLYPKQKMAVAMTSIEGSPLFLASVTPIEELLSPEALQAAKDSRNTFIPWSAGIAAGVLTALFLLIEILRRGKK